MSPQESTTDETPPDPRAAVDAEEPGTEREARRPALRRAAVLVCLVGAVVAFAAAAYLLLAAPPRVSESPAAFQPDRRGARPEGDGPEGRPRSTGAPDHPQDRPRRRCPVRRPHVRERDGHSFASRRGRLVQTRSASRQRGQRRDRRPQRLRRREGGGLRRPVPAGQGRQALRPGRSRQGDLLRRAQDALVCTQRQRRAGVRADHAEAPQPDHLRRLLRRWPPGPTRSGWSCSRSCSLRRGSARRQALPRPATPAT